MTCGAFSPHYRLYKKQNIQLKNRIHSLLKERLFGFTKEEIFSSKRRELIAIAIIADIIEVSRFRDSKAFTCAPLQKCQIQTRR